MNKGIKILLSIIILTLLAVLIIISSSSQIYTDWLWFKNLGFASTFTTMFFANFVLRIIVGLIFTLFIYLNLIFTRKPLIEYINVKTKDNNVESMFGGSNSSFSDWLDKKKLNYIFLFGSIVLGFLFSSINPDLWKIVLKYFNRQPFGTTDPIFAKDIGFYVFSLPFLNFLREMGMVLVVLTLIVVGIIYILASGISSLSEMKLKLTSRAQGHITILVVLFLFLKAVSYRLSMYDILYSAKGVVYGAGYTDVNANLLGLRILFVIAILIGILMLVNLFRKSYKLLLYGLGFWLLMSLVFGSIYPGIIQQFEVTPNEIAKESSYIENNINMTLKAYGLDNIKEKEFNVLNNLTNEDLDENKATLDNIRLWDPRPLRSTYNQTQGLRPYYTFNNVDIDRYYIDGEYQQVMLAARELEQTKLSAQAQTWINQKLKYTHGYGIAMSPVNEVTTDGLPEFYVKDIPAKTSVDLELDNSSIYYGEMTNDYIIANNKTDEFHYPRGDKNEYISYDGTGGVELNNLFKKLIFTVKHGNIKFLLSDDIHDQSRIMYYRNIKQRVRKTAPFLEYDNDPYLVVENGRLFWIQDAYTTSSRYPYSRPTRIGIRRTETNYIRNSVKVVIDAYNGTMDYYIIDKSDPLANAYARIFPDLFKDGTNMPDEIKKHLRYPQDLFEIQSNMYSIYHMTDPTVFYNQEDIWNIPNENYNGSTIKMEPYYVNMELPESDKLEFLLMQPFTPDTKNNMIAWMAGRSDGENYGDLVLYNFPKDTLVYGPNQIESRIDQNADISQMLSLWGQRGSRVIRGNLLVIPIEKSILYVEPLYLQAETSELPELKRVIVSYKDRIAMRPTLDQAIDAVFEKKEVITENEVDPDQIEDDLIQKPKDLQSLSNEAWEIYQEAQQSLQEGDFTEYGQLITELEDILKKINELSSQ
ncbi:MAG: UPF0182 family protein [bacterium]